MQKNAVIGAAVNFDQYAVKNFILSFREVNKDDDLILFVDSKNLPIFQEVFADKNITFTKFKYYEFIDTPIHNARYLEYLEFLLDNPQYKNIFFADTKDIVFQDNLFENLPDEFLYLFKEDSGIKIGDDFFYNSWWIHCAYGNEILYKIGYNNIICSGTILGSYNEMIKLLERFKSELLQIKKNDRNVFQHTILDQAIMNYLGYMGIENNSNLEIKSNGEIVATLGASFGNPVAVPANFDVNSIDARFLQTPQPLDQITINGDIGCVKLNDNFPAVVHQYDRNHLLKNMYDGKYILT